MVDKFAPNKVYALTDSKLYRSTDYGVNWTRVLAANDGQTFFEIKQHPNNSGTFYVTGNNSFYYSNTDGTSWENRSNTIEPNGTWRFAVDCSEDNILYGFLHKYEGKKTLARKIYKCTNQVLFKWNTYPVQNITCSNTIGHTIKALRNGVIYIGVQDNHSKFTYNGSGFIKDILKNLHVDVRAFCFPNNDTTAIFIGTDGGISKNLLGSGTSFNHINGDLALNECYDVAIHESNREYLLTGAHDNGTM